MSVGANLITLILPCDAIGLCYARDLHVCRKSIAILIYKAGEYVCLNALISGTSGPN